MCTADILPVYHLGHSQLFTVWGPAQLSRRLRVAVGVFWGAYYLPLPRKHDLVSVAGHPIPGVLCFLTTSPVGRTACRCMSSSW